MPFQFARLRGPVVLVLLALLCPESAGAGTRTVRRGDDLQAVLNSAVAGDVLLLEAGAEFVGNFILPVTSGSDPIVVRSAVNAQLPIAGQRIAPQQATLLARLRSPNTSPALRTAAGAHHWQLQYLEFAGTQNGYGDLIQIGDGSSAQNTIEKVPYEFVLSHLYIHGDALLGQKRCVALNAARVTIRDSHISDCKGVGQDTQAICGWNGPGPYVIENNYLEGAGENVMFGGADPAIPNLVADGITFRRNLVSRPMSWRDPIIGTPQKPSGTATTGGALAAGAYAYRIVARRGVGQGTMGRSTASIEATVSVTAPASAVRLTWQPVAGATEYQVYGRSAGAQSAFWTVTGTTFTDTGTAGTAGAVPTSTGTVWTVKNLFELKNARNVVIEDNIFENHWKEAQPGWSIVLTPRNSNGGCAWCVVEHVRFEYNVVRNVAAGINVLGYDNGNPSRQAADIVFRENLFTGVSTALGGNGWFLQLGDGPRDIILEHNTIDSNGNTIVYVYGGTSTDPREVYGFQMIANAARHDTYGINGAYFAYGNAILSAFFPDGIFTANYLAGGSSSRYPVGTLVDGVFTEQFANPPSDFTVRAGSPLKRAAPGGRDVGVDYPTLAARLADVTDGVIRPPAPAKVHVVPR